MAKNKSIIRVKKCKENPFAQIDKVMLNNKKISWKAKGLLCYLLSKPDNWKISVSHLIKEATDGEASLRSALKELRSIGYIILKCIRDNFGKIINWEYIIFEKPDGDFPHVENPVVDNHYTNNNDFNNNDFNNKEAGQSPEFIFNKNFFDSFKEIFGKNPIGDTDEDKNRYPRLIRQKCKKENIDIVKVLKWAWDYNFKKDKDYIFPWRQCQVSLKKIYYKFIPKYLEDKKSFYDKIESNKLRDKLIKNFSFGKDIIDEAEKVYQNSD